MRHRRGILGVLGIWIASALLGPTLAQDLEVSRYSLVSKSRVGRTEFEYTYRATITNTGLDVENVTAALSSGSPHTVVIDGDLSFGTVGSHATVTSADTFTIRQNRLYPFSWQNLSWSIVVVVQDFDQDGYISSIDPDDNNPSTYPGALELCDRMDNDGDGRVDEGTGCEVCQ